MQSSVTSCLYPRGEMLDLPCVIRPHRSTAAWRYPSDPCPICDLMLIEPRLDVLGSIPDVASNLEPTRSSALIVPAVKSLRRHGQIRRHLFKGPKVGQTHAIAFRR